MNRTRMTLSAIVLASCRSDPETVVASAHAGDAYHAAARTDSVGVVASVTGGTEQSFSQGELRRHVTFNVRRHADGRVDGHFVVSLHGPARRVPEPRELVDAIRYEVTCLALEGNRAWVGGRIVGPRDDPYRGGEDVWYVEDGTAGAPDRVAVWIGRAARRCTERSPATGWPSERGTLVVRTLLPGA